MFKKIKKFLLLGIIIQFFSCLGGIVFAGDYVADIVVVGNKAVGKSTLISWLTDGAYSIRLATANVGYRTKILRSEKDNNVYCTFWDTPAFDRIDDQIKNLVISKANIVFIVVDCSCKPESSEYVHSLDEAMKKYVGTINKKFPNCKVIVAGHKIDLLSEKDLAKLETQAEHAKGFYGESKFEYTLTSMENGSGKEKLIGILSKLLDDSGLKPLNEEGGICGLCGSRCNQSSFNGYCCYEHQAEAEGTSCKYCHKKFLKKDESNGDYCCYEHRLQCDGTSCPYCHEKFFKRDNSNGNYCCYEHRLEHEGKFCKYCHKKGINKKFLPGKGYDNDYCSKGCHDKDGCVIV